MSNFSHKGLIMNTIEINADRFCEIQEILEEIALEDANWAFIEAFEGAL